MFALLLNINIKKVIEEFLENIKINNDAQFTYYNGNIFARTLLVHNECDTQKWIIKLDKLSLEKCKMNIHTNETNVNKMAIERIEFAYFKTVIISRERNDSDIRKKLFKSRSEKITSYVEE